MPHARFKSLTPRGRVKDFPMTHAVAVALLFSAFNILTQLGTSPMQGFTVGFMVLFAIGSAATILVGLQYKGNVYHAYGIERTGHILALGAWLIDGYLLVTFGAWLHIGVPLAFFIAHILRAQRLSNSMRDIRMIIEGKMLQAQVMRNGD